MIVPIPELCICSVCGECATLHKTRDDNQMCHPCMEQYGAFCDDIAHEGEADALRPLAQAVRRYAALRVASQPAMKGPRHG